MATQQRSTAGLLVCVACGEPVAHGLVCAGCLADTHDEPPVAGGGSR